MSRGKYMVRLPGGNFKTTDSEKQARKWLAVKGAELMDPIADVRHGGTNPTKEASWNHRT